MQLKLGRKQQFYWNGDYELYLVTQTELSCRCSTFSLTLEAEQIEIEAMIEQQLIITVQGLQKISLEHVDE